MRSIIIGSVFVALILLTPVALAENRVEIDVAKSGAGSIPYDTLYVGGEYEFRIWVENDIALGSFVFTYAIWSDDSATWIPVSKPEGYGDKAAVTVVLGSRMDPPEAYFDMFNGILVSDFNFDGGSSDTIAMSAMSYQQNFPPGEMDHVLSIHFSLTGLYTDGEYGTLCIDTTSWQCACPDNAFQDIYGSLFIPDLNCAHCWPVKFLCGNPNGDNDVNVGDAVFMINYVFREGPPPDPWQLGDANCDGTLDVGDVVFLVAAAFRFGPQPECCD
jgi:hypothetical protein